jgi:hypothetical protein
LEAFAVEEYPRSDNFKKISRFDVNSADDFQSSTVRKLYNWWEEFKPGLPTRADFDITRHWTIAKSLYLVEALAPGEYLHRLNGEAVVDIIGVSLRGHEISSSGPLPELRRLADYLDLLVMEKKPGRCTGYVEIPGGRQARFETVDCPLLRPDGSVGFLLGAISLLD